MLKEDREGKERNFLVIKLSKGKIAEKELTEVFNREKAKLFPDDIGMIVNDFLTEHFTEILDYNFTANVEKDFDHIAAGKMEWPRMIRNFYEPFHEQVETTLKTTDYSKGEREIGRNNFV